MSTRSTGRRKDGPEAERRQLSPANKPLEVGIDTHTVDLDALLSQTRFRRFMKDIDDIEVIKLDPQELDESQPSWGISLGPNKVLVDIHTETTFAKALAISTAALGGGYAVAKLILPYFAYLLSLVPLY